MYIIISVKAIGFTHYLCYHISVFNKYIYHKKPFETRLLQGKSSNVSITAYIRVRNFLC